MKNSSSTDSEAPSTPTGLKETPNSDGGVKLRWSGNSESDLASYKVYGGTTASPTTLLSTVSSGTETYKQISLSRGETYYYRDGYFSINNPDNDLITVTSPNGCEVWYKNETYTITWDDPTSYTGSMVISLWDGGTKISDIGYGGSGSISWTISSSIPTGDNYFIVVARTQYTWVYDASNQSFSIE
jgi:hypothetical protein